MSIADSGVDRNFRRVLPLASRGTLEAFEALVGLDLRDGKDSLRSTSVGSGVGSGLMMLVLAWSPMVARLYEFTKLVRLARIKLTLDVDGWTIQRYRSLRVILCDCGTLTCFDAMWSSIPVLYSRSGLDGNGETFLWAGTGRLRSLVGVSICVDVRKRFSGTSWRSVFLVYQGDFMVEVAVLWRRHATR